MRYLILPRGSSVATGSKTPVRHAKLVIRTKKAKWMIRYTYYAFIFSLPFEQIDIGTASPLPKLIGVTLAAIALFQPRLCYKFPPKAFWWFAIYLFGYTLSGAYLFLTRDRVPGFAGLLIFGLLQLTQLLILFWISYNLLKHERVIKGTLWALAAGTIILAILQTLGITTTMEGSRVTAFDANPNTIATGLSLGLLALVGLAFGREKRDWKAISLFWLGAGIVAIAIVQTGSRGAVIALMGSLSIFFLKGKSLATKLKLGLIALVGIAVLGFASYQVDAVRKRWEQTIYEGNLAGRELIFPAALEMILEKPLLGWGPVNHYWELGSRLGELSREPHNLYLWMLEEMGIFGAIPFFIGLWLCCRSAWRARHSIQGVLPLIMLLFILIMNLRASTHITKFFWLVLSYALASSAYVAVARARQYPASRLARRATPSGLRERPGVTIPGVGATSHSSPDHT